MALPIFLLLPCMFSVLSVAQSSDQQPANCELSQTAFYTIRNGNGCYLKVSSDGSLGCGPLTPTECTQKKPKSTNNNQASWECTRGDSEGSELWYFHSYMNQTTGIRLYSIRNKKVDVVLEVTGQGDNASLSLATYDRSKIFFAGGRFAVGQVQRTVSTTAGATNSEEDSRSSHSHENCGCHDRSHGNGPRLYRAILGLGASGSLGSARQTTPKPSKGILEGDLNLGHVGVQVSLGGGKPKDSAENGDRSTTPGATQPPKYEYACSIYSIGGQAVFGFENTTAVLLAGDNASANASSSATIFQDLSFNWHFEKKPCDPFPYQSYRLKHRSTGKVAGVQSGVTENEASVDLLDPNQATGDNARLMFVQEANYTLGQYSVYLKHSDRVLTVDNGTVSTGGRIFQYDQLLLPQQIFSISEGPDGSCLVRDTANQRFVTRSTAGTTVTVGDTVITKDALWDLEPFGWVPYEMGNAYSIRSTITDKCWAVHSGGMLVVEQSTCSTTAALQRFYFLRFPNSTAYYIRQTFLPRALQQATDNSLGLRYLEDAINKKFRLSDVVTTDGSNVVISPFLQGDGWTYGVANKSTADGVTIYASSASGSTGDDWARVWNLKEIIPMNLA